MQVWRALLVSSWMNGTRHPQAAYARHLEGARGDPLWAKRPGQWYKVCVARIQRSGQHTGFAPQIASLLPLEVEVGWLKRLAPCWSCSVTGAVGRYRRHCPERPQDTRACHCKSGRKRSQERSVCVFPYKMALRTRSPTHWCSSPRTVGVGRGLSLFS